MSSKKILRAFVWIWAVGFVLVNVVAFFHAWKFTHYGDPDLPRTRPAYLTTRQKVKIWFMGINNPRPESTVKPSVPFETIYIDSNKKIECWKISADSAIGTVILFHDFNTEKSNLLKRAEVFLDLGYNTLLVDFMGSGGSEGNQTTMGFLEAEQVKSVYEYVAKNGKSRIFLLGMSMGAVAVMKAVHEYKLEPRGILLESPFGSAYDAVAARFQAMDAPSFPMAGLLIFWGGIQNGFWLFSHNPVSYAKDISVPTLLMFGAHHNKVTRAEIDEIYLGLKGEKELAIHEDSGNELYVSDFWIANVKKFLSRR